MYTVRDWIQKFKAGEFDSKSHEVQGDVGWGDWFCQDKALRGRTYKLAGLITRLKEGGKIDFDRHHVAFINNSPAYSAPLYDAVFFVTLENGIFNHYIITVDDKRQEYKYVVFDGTVSYADPVLMANKRSDIIKWFNNEPLSQPNPLIVKALHSDY